MGTRCLLVVWVCTCAATTPWAASDVKVAQHIARCSFVAETERPWAANDVKV